MSWHLDLRWEVRLTRNGRSQPPAPNATVAMLLTGLAARKGEWTDRATLAALLYPLQDPDKARAALRQSLRRLRIWIGEEGIESDGDLVRLSDSAWTVELGHGEVPVAPGLTHPWMDRLRDQWFPSQTSAAPVQEFVNTVERAALLDRNVARAVLVGGRVLSQSLKMDTLLGLLAQTRFDDRRDPFVMDHMAMRAQAEVTLMAFQQATATYHKMSRLAHHLGNRREIKRCLIESAFLELEIGDIRSARQSFSLVGEPGDLNPDRLLAANCRGCYYWNLARYDQALEEMRLAMRFVPSVDRTQRLHYIHNYAVLAAEAGETKLALDLIDRAREYLVPEMHTYARYYLELALNTVDLRMGRVGEAVAGFTRLYEEAGSFQWTISQVYCEERLAECYAREGNSQRAKATWQRAESQRRAAGAKPNPRLIALKARALSGC